MKHVGIFILFLLLGTFGYIGIKHFLLPKSTVNNLSVSQTQTPFPTSAFSMEKAPSQSIRGQVASISGIVMWQSRVATAPATFTYLSTIQQGELLQTQPTGIISLTFPNSGGVTIHPSTELNFIQTLPTSVVFQEDYGNVSYTRSGPIPVSIRTLHLLTQLDTGEADIGVDTDNALVSISIATGSARIAYNDANTISSVTTIPAGKQVTFDDTTREITVTNIK